MAKSDFLITETKDDETVNFRISGRVNSKNANELEFKLERTLREEEGKNIVLNMSKVEYLSSTGIRVILKIFRLSKDSGIKFNIEFPSENVRNVLGITALDELLLK